jgi:hypothetical protein
MMTTHKTEVTGPGGWTALPAGPVVEVDHSKLSLATRLGEEGSKEYRRLSEEYAELGLAYVKYRVAGPSLITRVIESEMRTIRMALRLMNPNGKY